jgi:2-iminobutanoate/2-iminopropanoate deaminase
VSGAGVGAVVATGDAPAAIGPYVQARVVDGFAYCSGQIGLDPASGALVEGGVVAETRRALANLEAVLRAAGAGLASVVKTTVFLVDMAEFAAMNEVYAEVFAAPYPARSTVAVAALPRGARVEIEAVARLG